MASMATSSTPARLYSGDALLQRLAQDFQHMAPKLGQLIQAAHAMVRPRHLARPGEVLAADPPHSRDRLRRGRDTGGS
jgi:hypothetical protein